jgi:hypothetical protein
MFHNDWIDNKIDLIWLTNVFHSQIVNLKNRRLLLLDEHASHVLMKFIKFCWLINIVSLCFSFHITHYLQFLDDNYFDSLNKTYRKQLDKRNKIEMMHIIKLNFFAFSKEARKEVMTKSIIKSI